MVIRVVGKEAYECVGSTPCRPRTLIGTYSPAQNQEGSKDRLWEYVAHWYRWLHGGLKGSVTRKGGINRYYIYILRRLGIP